MEQDIKPGKGVFSKLRARATSFGSTDNQGKRTVLPQFVAKAEDKEGVENVNSNITNSPKNSRDFKSPVLVANLLTPYVAKAIPELDKDGHVPRSPTPILPDTLELPELQLEPGRNDSAAVFNIGESAVANSCTDEDTSGGTMKSSGSNILGAENVLQNSFNRQKEILLAQQQPQRNLTPPTKKALIGTIARPAYPLPHVCQQSTLFRPCVRTPLCDFKLADELPRKSRIALASLQRLDAKLRCEGYLKVLTKEFLRGKREKDRDSKADANDILEIDAKQLGEKRKSVIPNSPGSALDRLGAFLKLKKAKKKTRNVLLHLLNLAIHDDRSEHACELLTMVSSSTLRKKKPHEANRMFLLAMAKRMENVALIMFEKGFPMDVNAPIFGNGPATGDVRSQQQSSNVPTENTGSSIPFAFPSFFILAVGLGLDVLVRAMIKRANLNQTWFGLTPLILAITRQGVGSALMVNILLEHGADPGQGMCVEQLYGLIRIKRGTGTATSPGKDTSSFLSKSGSSGGQPLNDSRGDRSTALSLSRKKSGKASHTLFQQNSTSRFATAPLKIVTNLKEPSQHFSHSDPLPTDVDKKGFPRQVILHADGAEERKQASARRHGRTYSQKGESIDNTNDVTDATDPQTGVTQVDSSRVGDGTSVTQESVSPLIGLRRRLSVSVKGKIAKELDGFKVFEKRLSKNMEIKEDVQSGPGEDQVQGKIVLPVEFAAAVGNSSCVYYVLRRYESRRPLVDSQFGLLVQQNLPITAQLLNAGAPVTQHESRGSTALHLAARTDAVQILYALLAVGINCNTPGENGWTALHEAVSQKAKTAALALVDHGADLNAKTEDGDTPASIGSKIGLDTEELKSFFDTTKIRTTDHDEKEKIHQYIVDIINESKKVPLSNFTYPPKVGVGRKRSETAPASNEMLDAAQQGKGESLVSAASAGASISSPYPQTKRKTAMERFGFRPRSASGGPASIADLTTMSSRTLPEVTSIVQLDARSRSTSAPLTYSQTVASESRTSIGEATTIPSDQVFSQYSEHPDPIP